MNSHLPNQPKAIKMVTCECFFHEDLHHPRPSYDCFAPCKSGFIYNERERGAKRKRKKIYHSTGFGVLLLFEFEDIILFYLFLSKYSPTYNIGRSSYHKQKNSQKIHQFNEYKRLGTSTNSVLFSPVHICQVLMV